MEEPVLYRNIIPNLARFLLQSKGDVRTALAMAEEKNIGTRAIPVIDIFKDAVSAGGSDWGTQLRPAVLASQSFFGSLRSLSLFDFLVSDGIARVLPFNRITSSVSEGLTGYTAASGSVKKLSKLSLGTVRLFSTTAVAMVVVSTELLRMEGAENLVGTELRSATAAATNDEFLAWLVAQVETANVLTSTGNLPDDLRAALGVIPLHAGSRIIIVASPALVGRISTTKVTGTNEFAYPNVGPAGGEVIPGVFLYPSASLLPSFDSPGEERLLVLDGSQIALASDAMNFASSKNALMQMSDTPDDPASAATVLESLWQRNLAALRTERVIAFGLARPTGILATIENVGY